MGFWRNVHQRQNTNCIFTEENFQDEMSTNNCTRRAPFYFPIRMDHNHLFWSSCVKALKEHASSCTLLRFPLERKIKSWSSLIFCFPVEMATGVTRLCEMFNHVALGDAAKVLHRPQAPCLYALPLYSDHHFPQSWKYVCRLFITTNT